MFVVDVSFGDRTRFLFDEWEDKGVDVTWIDHHKTAIEAVKDYNVKGKRRIGTEDSSDARSIPPRRRWMSRLWHARPTPVEEAIRRLPASSLAWRI